MKVIQADWKPSPLEGTLGMKLERGLVSDGGIDAAKGIRA